MAARSNGVAPVRDLRGGSRRAARTHRTTNRVPTRPASAIHRHAAVGPETLWARTRRASHIMFVPFRHIVHRWTWLLHASPSASAPLPTSAGYRPYCSTNGCTSFLEIDDEGRVAQCPICGYIRRGLVTRGATRAPSSLLASSPVVTPSSLRRHSVVTPSSLRRRSAAERSLESSPFHVRVQRSCWRVRGRLAVDSDGMARFAASTKRSCSASSRGRDPTEAAAARATSASICSSSLRASLSASIQGGAAPALRSIRWAIAHSPAALSSSSGSRSP